ncbi:YceI family protein [Mycobacterium sp. AMU20-3851]|uniref:YceI family protein n=1 Tax=Mycobacterium sp. AMU20-3851 TaxID=3122055 RepID=UPI00375492E1
MNRKRWLVVVGLLAVLTLGAVAAAPWAYMTFVADPPQPAWALPPDSHPAGTAVDGTWTVQPGSQAGYRVQQKLLWERVDVNGRTDAVTGSAEITGSQLTSIEVTVDPAAMQSGSPGRDEKFRSADALETATFPSATLTGAAPVDVSAVPADGSPLRLEIPVTLTLKGVTRPATAQAEIQRNGERVDVAGTIAIRLPDFNVVPPKPAAGLLEVQPDATIEFLVHLAK